MWIANAVSPIGVETRESARATDSFSIDAQTTGAKAANLFTGFTNPTLNVVSGNLARSSGSHKFAKASDAQTATFVSTYNCMDSEVSVRSGVGKIALRYDAATASCITFAFGDGSVSAGFNTSGANLTDFNNLNTFTWNANLADFGWTALNEDDIFTVGLVGFSGYVKWNGTTVLTFTNLFQPIAGKCVLWAHPSYDGIGDASISYLPATLYSNRARRLYDLRDFGLKTSQTTGSIASGSNQLTVADASGFNVGDGIIVATGGEAGAGLRGTMGVGGAWPPLSYADATAMATDTTQGSNTPCWLRSTGYVYRYVSGTWTINRSADSPDGVSLDNGDFYTQKAGPMALVATITAKSGNVLTLSQLASAAATSAEVHFDNYSAFYPLTAASPTYLSLRVPSGSYAFGQQVPALAGKHGFTLAGYGSTKPRLFAPKGAPALSVAVFNQSNFVTVSNLALEGNHKLGASGHAEYFSIPLLNGDFNSNWIAAAAIKSGSYCVVHDVDLTDVIAKAVNLEMSSNCQVTRCTLTMNAPVESYTQWVFQALNSSDCVYQDCSIPYSISILKTFETFVGTRCSFINCGGMNVVCSTNNSSYWLYDGFYSTITANSFYYVNAGWYGEAVMNVNNNSFHSATSGGTINNPRIVQTGYCTSNNDTFPAIQVAPDVTNVVIQGQYSGVSTPFSTALGGYISAPDYAVIDPNVTGRHGASVGRSIIIEAPGTIVQGLRIVGACKSGEASIKLASTATGATVAGCIADAFIYQADTTKSGNRTNAGITIP